MFQIDYESRYWLESELERQKQEGETLISTRFQTLPMEDMAQILASAHAANCTVAARVIDELNLSQKQIYAIENNLEGFEIEMLKDDEERQISALEG